MFQDHIIEGVRVTVYSIESRLIGSVYFKLCGALVFQWRTPPAEIYLFLFTAVGTYIGVEHSYGTQLQDT